MNTEHERFKEILAEATAKASPTERFAYLDEACRGDPALRARIESMLAAHDRAGGFLEEPVIAVSQQTEVLPMPPAQKPGSRIGHYKLLEQIGEGGCGVSMSRSRKHQSDVWNFCWLIWSGIKETQK